MSQYPVLGGGTRVDDQFLSDLIDNYVIKPADATPVVNQTLVNDADLTFPVLANAVYDVTFNVRWAGLQAAGLRIAWSVPAGTTGNRECYGPGPNNVVNSGSDTTSMRWAVVPYATAVLYTNPRDSVSSQVFTIESTILSVGSTAGSVTLQWAQKTTNATGSLVNASSYVKYRRIG